MEKVTFLIEKADLDQIDKLCGNYGHTVRSDIIRKAIKKYLSEMAIGKTPREILEEAKLERGYHRDVKKALEEP